MTTYIIKGYICKPETTQLLRNQKKNSNFNVTLVRNTRNAPKRRHTNDVIITIQGTS